MGCIIITPIYRIVMLCSSILQLRAPRLFDNDLENNTWYLEHNAEYLQENLNRIMQRFMGIIASTLVYDLHIDIWMLSVQVKL